jgi:transcriptional regulator with XRE-family HTH domain
MIIQQSLNTREIGERVRQLRKARAITQDELGYVLGDKLTGKPLSRGQVSNLETGKRNFNIHQLKVLADFFKVSMETLGIESSELATVDLFERARFIFESRDIPIDEKQELYEGIMELYLSAKEQIKNNAQH